MSEERDDPRNRPQKGTEFHGRQRKVRGSPAGAHRPPARRPALADLRQVVLGVDPGTAICGYGLVGETPGGELVALAYDVITTPPALSLAERLGLIYAGISDLIRRYQPDSVAVEELFFSKNARTALAVGQARGVVLLAAVHGQRPVAEYTPLQVKDAVVGYGRAEKRQIQEMVRMLLQLERIPQPDDAADALAVAICHIHSSRLNQLLEAKP